MSRPTPASISITFPSARLTYSPAVIADFTEHNADGHGSAIVLVRFDGTTRALIPPTKDIDPELRATLQTYIDGIAVSPTVPCAQFAAVFLLRFDVPSGVVHHLQIKPPATGAGTATGAVE